MRCLAVSVALTLLASCGGSSESGADSPVRVDTTVPVGSNAARPDATEPVTPPSDTDVTAPSTPAPTAPAPTASTTPAPADDLVGLEGIGVIRVVTPIAGNGEHPLLSWEQVDGAARYALVLNRSNGEAYWAWSGPESEIYLGGSTEPPPDDGAGPYLTEPVTMRVVAVDDAGVIVAASPPVEIAP